MTLSVSGLTVSIGGTRLVDDLAFTLGDGDRLGLIGESGSGKSLTLLSLVGLAPDEAEVTGSVRLDGRELVGLPERALARLRGSDVAMVFQDPLAALNPLRTVGRQIGETLRIHERLSAAAARTRAVEAAREVNLPDPETIVDLYPHQLSGGQRQRVGIAMALIGRPAILLADEPTTALDVTTQAEVLALLHRLVEERGMSLLFVTHDLAVLSQIVTDAVVLANGRAVETGALDTLLHSPTHPVTQGLVAAARDTTWSAS
ncbi:ABC transporter ATP-binding protein [Frondihabitans australicus]|uniref:Peptide/nickel transport system ATP-binding protein n=1 Tax=Frondihabitans australicus TaxID=386892 RepID=A0A495IDP1_9MICO|nr:ABC transporter ATP-binding protein [Frondihabitans australicus]RKR73760.1 peptide/nickel transport system ATP-binding protein [Frondihabitans australicus]